MPYRVQKPYIILNGQKLVSPTAVQQRMPFCDTCNELAATHASAYAELAPADGGGRFRIHGFHANRKR